MLLLATLIALFAERLAPALAERRSLCWFDHYFDALRGRLNSPGWLVLLVLIAPWALLTAVVQIGLHDALWGLLELAFGVLALFFALRPGSVDPAIDAYVSERERGNDDAARHHAEHLLGGSAPESVEDEVRAVADALLWEASERWVAPILWFVVLGPLGAVVYRLTVHVEARAAIDAKADTLGSNELYAAARLLRAALDWLPARLLAAMYILSGSFEDGLSAWRRKDQRAVDVPVAPEAGDDVESDAKSGATAASGAPDALTSRAQELEDENRGLLLRVGRAALRTDDYSVSTEISDSGEIEADASIVRAARGLVLRSVVVIVAMIALLTLGDWIR
jgi:membrane protein required for beta-lactamase induction